MKVFLGGTCAGPDYRTKLIPLLEENDIDYFNPVVEDWNEDCIAEEERQKNFECDVHLYILTPYLEGCYSVAEVIASCLGKYPTEKITVFAFYDKFAGKEFNKHQVKSYEAVGKMVNESGQFWLSGFKNNLEAVATAFKDFKGLIKD